MMRACEEPAAKEGFLGEADRILIYNTGSGYKYLEAWKQYLNET